MRGSHCFFYPFTDLGWHKLDANGSSDGPREEGFIWHHAPGCVHLPGNTRFCFHRCDTATCMLQEARPYPNPALTLCHVWGRDVTKQGDHVALCIVCTRMASGALAGYTRFCYH